MNINIEKLTGNKRGDLDTFLLNSTKFTQEDREIIMEGVVDWIEQL